jgi:hypothetical protein
LKNKETESFYTFRLRIKALFAAAFVTAFMFVVAVAVVFAMALGRTITVFRTLMIFVTSTVVTAGAVGVFAFRIVASHYFSPHIKFYTPRGYKIMYPWGV